METRTEKWGKYRQEIKMSSDSEFGPSSRTDSLSEDDYSRIATAKKSGLAIGYGQILQQPIPVNSSSAGGDASAQRSPYSIYRRKKATWLIIKLSLLLLVAIAFVVVYFIFIKGAN